jgi:CRISPR-associated protein Cmx8
VIRYSVSSVEYLHLKKDGNRVLLLGSGRVVPKPELLEAYQAIITPAGRRRYRNPLFRSGLLLSLLRDRRWYECLAPVLAERPWPFFVRGEQAPKNIPWFAADVAARFAEETQGYEAALEEANVTQSSEPVEAPLPLLIHRLVKAYVTSKAKEKASVPKKKLKELCPEKRKEVYEQREKIAASIFLEMRSRREQDFVDHFTATFCSTKQFLPERDFRIVAEALLAKPEDIQHFTSPERRLHRDDVKTLTLLALSANS